MRNVFKEYRHGLISWDEAFLIANNMAASCSEDTDYWADQMDSLGCDAAVQLMIVQYSYKQNEEGLFYRKS